jgi:hypothetical protein
MTKSEISIEIGDLNTNAVDLIELNMLLLPDFGTYLQVETDREAISPQLVGRIKTMPALPRSRALGMEINRIWLTGAPCLDDFHTYGRRQRQSVDSFVYLGRQLKIFVRV